MDAPAKPCTAPRRPSKLSPEPPADEPQLLRWHGPNITAAMLGPRPVDVTWITRYKILAGRVFVHMKDRGAVLDNVTCRKYASQTAKHPAAVPNQLPANDISGVVQ